MIGLSSETKDEMLAIFTSQALTVGLFDGDDEIADPRYTRLPVQFGPPQGDDTRYIENLDEILWDDFARDHRIDHWGVFDYDGKLKARDVIEKPRLLPAEDRFFFAPGNVRLILK